VPARDVEVAKVIEEPGRPADQHEANRTVQPYKNEGIELPNQNQNQETAGTVAKIVGVQPTERTSASEGEEPRGKLKDVVVLNTAAPPPPAQALFLVEQQQAIADLDRAIQLDPNDAEAYNTRGNVWDDMGDADRALADYEQAIRIDPNNPSTFRDRAILWRHKGELDRALVDFDRAIRLSFSDAQVYSDRGLLWYEKGHHDRAIADFRRAAKIDPDFAIAYINRGVIVHHGREIDHASPDLDQAIHVDPSVFDAIRRENLHPRAATHSSGTWFEERAADVAPAPTR
jgi:tetratricopeptide (TPR) repeat protein